MVDLVLLIGLVVCAHVFLRAFETMSTFSPPAVQRLAQIVAICSLLAAAGMVFTAVSMAGKSLAR